MHRSKIKQITLAVCLALMPFSGYAAGLGKLNVSSGLGEPLKAEIELLSVTPEELSTLVAAIASEEAYAAQGVTRLGIHNNIQVEVTKSSNGSPILKLRSSQPISDPYLDMLIQVDWASGRLQREYTVLLDPPGYQQPAENAAPMAVSPPSVSMPGSSLSSSDSTQASNKKTKKSGKRSAPALQDESVASPSADELTTQRGDTLSTIAKQMQVEGVSLDQILIGLYENNKSAFSGGNMNRLKVGQIIRVPAKESLTAVDKKDARQSVKVHSDNWNAYRNNLAGVVAEAPAITDVEQKQASSGKIGTAQDKATPAKVGPQDVVKLSAGEKQAAAGAAKEFEAKIVALQEETTAREKSLKEAQERTASLEKQIQDMQKLLALKSQTMTEVQKNAESAVKAPDAATTNPAPVAQTPEVKAESAPVAESQEPPKVEPAATDTAKPAEVAAAPVAKKIILPPPPQPEAEAGLFDGLMGGVDLTILGGAGAVALLGAGWMFLRNKRRKDLDSFERGILTSGGLRANTVFGNTTGTASTSDTSFLTDFAQSADGSMIDTNDVDPIAEAEVYMAYGRDAQAEEILKDAISKEPKRYELHLKLLEMYATRKDTSAFEAIAGELYTTLGAADPTWIKVAEIGHAMEPENPLYDVSKVVAVSSLATQKLDASDFADVAVSTDTGLDFSFDTDDTDAAAPTMADDANSAVMQSFSTPANVEQELSFDLGNLEGDVADSTPSENANTAQSAKQDVADNTMDFDLGSFNLDTESQSDIDSMKTMDNLAAFGETMPGKNNFEAPAFDLPAATENKEANVESFNMDFNLPDIETAESTQTIEAPTNITEEISFDLDVGAETSQFDIQPDTPISEISFDLPQIDEPSTNDTSVTAANEFDLSSISLDLSEPASELESVTSEEISLDIVAPESADVDIKLDLVAAYIDMDDKEGARELLQEVVKEGGPQQQKRATELLTSLA
ncbi:MAG TPA: FimV/HubP family polar landmark protein [Methylotenera sp.]|nr:FimV/HubP family polar landmark protein [Methylotenera sp.]